MARTPDPKSKSGFIRSQPRTMNAADVVKAAKASGIKLNERLVYGVRTKMNRKKNGGPKVPRVNTRPATSAHYLELEIERIVERKVDAMLKERLGSLLG